MKAKIISPMLAAALLLSGCSNPFADHRDIEHLLVIQTMGIDTDRGSVVLSLASAADSSGGEPKRLSALGSTVTAAMERIYDCSFEEELFCYHVKSVLVGEKAAEEGIDGLLGYICRSPIMRIDVPMFVVRSAKAGDVIMEAGDGERGISEIMQNLSRKLDRRDGGSFTAKDIMRSLRRSGSALITALSYEESTEEGSEEGENRTAAPGGYAVIRDGKLCKFIEPADAAAADMLLSRSGIYNIEVADSHGGKVVLEVSDGKAELTPIWDGGVLKGIAAHVSAQYSVLETNGRSELQNAEYVDGLTAALETELLQRAGNVLRTSADLKSDFLGLVNCVERSDPESLRAMKQSFPDKLPGLEFQVTVSCRISHTNDMKDL